MAYFLIFIGVILRLIPHPPNFAPISAISLFGAAHLRRKYAFIIPLLAMFISDVIIGFASFWVTISVYLSFVIIGLMGRWLKKRKNLPNIIGVSLTSSLLFFIITNFAVWASTPWYGKNIQGLVKCYWMAIPFFKNTLLGDLVYVGAMFGLYKLIKLFVSRKKMSLNKIIIKNEY